MCFTVLGFIGLNQIWVSFELARLKISGSWELGVLGRRAMFQGRDVWGWDLGFWVSYADIWESGFCGFRFFADLDLGRVRVGQRILRIVMFRSNDFSNKQIHCYEFKTLNIEHTNARLSCRAQIPKSQIHYSN